MEISSNEYIRENKWIERYNKRLKLQFCIKNWIKIIPNCRSTGKLYMFDNHPPFQPSGLNFCILFRSHWVKLTLASKAWFLLASIVLRNHLLFAPFLGPLQKKYKLHNSLFKQCFYSDLFAYQYSWFMYWCLMIFWKNHNIALIVDSSLL